MAKDTKHTLGSVFGDYEPGQAVPYGGGSAFRAACKANEPEQCSNCRFSQRQGCKWVCRKRAPHADKVDYDKCIINYPSTKKKEWCGDYKVKSNDQQPKPEEFSQANIIKAITQFLEYGEDSFVQNKKIGAPGHGGYYNRDGWAARCLQYYLEQLLADQATKESHEQ